MLVMSVSTIASAGDLRFGLSDQRDVEQVERRLNDILLTPDQSDLTERNSAEVIDDLKGVFGANPALEEAFRVNPKETLKLIALIRDAGGLAE